MDMLLVVAELGLSRVKRGIYVIGHSIVWLLVVSEICETGVKDGIYQKCIGINRCVFVEANIGMSMYHVCVWLRIYIHIQLINKFKMMTDSYFLRSSVFSPIT